VIRYIEAVITEEWPLLRKGQAGPRTSAIVDDLWRTTVEWQPTSPGETNLQASALRAVTQLAELRRSRHAVRRARRAQAPRAGIERLRRG
jgi:hypothetical protein